MCVTSGAETANFSGAPDSTPDFIAVRAAQSLVFCVVFCKSLFVVFLLAIALSVLITLFVSSNFFLFIMF